MSGRKARQPQSTLAASDDALQTVCGWLGVSMGKYKATESDYSVEPETHRPQLGGVGSENLSKKAIKKQTDGVMALGGLERKIIPKDALRGAAAEGKKRAAPESDSDDGMDKGTAQRSKQLDTRAELEQHAAKQRAKKRKRKSREAAKAAGSPSQSPRGAPMKAPPVLLGADD